MTETQQRFLRAIAERVPSTQVVEVHLFPPIRQGGVETGVAVVAEDPRRPEPTVESNAAIEESNGAVEAPIHVEPSALGATDLAESAADVEMSASDDADAEFPTGVADAAAEVGVAATEVAVAEARAAKAENGSLSRFTIHTARYRLTLKGVDRGKWDFDVVAEADAPLDAVDAVVRGVQRRAGEGAQPDRLTTDAFRDALEAPLSQLER